jgi:predicted NBD/HSP70 family sugar kinase
LTSRYSSKHDTTTQPWQKSVTGAGRGEGNMIYIIVSTGIVAELIIDHKVFRGA